MASVQANNTDTVSHSLTFLNKMLTTEQLLRTYGSFLVSVHFIYMQAIFIQ